jgi:hypothetical protein
MSEYSEGIMSDGACILKDGLPLPIEGIVSELNEIDRLRTQLAEMRKGEPYLWVTARGTGIGFSKPGDLEKPWELGMIPLFLAAPKLPEGIEKDAARYRLLREPLKQPVDPDNMLLVGASAGDDIVDGRVLDGLLDAMLNAAPEPKEGE